MAGTRVDFLRDAELCNDIADPPVMIENRSDVPKFSRFHRAIPSPSVSRSLARAFGSRNILHAPQFARRSGAPGNNQLWSDEDV
jgi:hypothetical protein